MRGLQGETGATGVDGPQGLQGNEGPQGPVGPQGTIKIARFLHPFLTTYVSLCNGILALMYPLVTLTYQSLTRNAYMCR